MKTNEISKEQAEDNLIVIKKIFFGYLSKLDKFKNLSYLSKKYFDEDGFYISSGVRRTNNKSLHFSGNAIDISNQNPKKIYELYYKLWYLFNKSSYIDIGIEIGDKKNRHIHFAITYPLNRKGYLFYEQKSKQPRYFGFTRNKKKINLQIIKNFYYGTSINIVQKDNIKTAFIVVIIAGILYLYNTKTK